MKVDIWSDVVCPFCYIGKRHFEQALADFADKDSVEVRWHSFELDPHAGNDARPMIDALMEKYGQSREQAEGMMDRVIGMGKEAGLDLRLKQSIRANTFNAHRLLHLAAARGLQDQAKERLLSAYFTEGENVNDPQTLARLLDEVGINDEDVLTTLENDTYAESVRADERQAREMGITGVPFFVFNDKYAISGAQPVAAFKQVLEKVAAENPKAKLEVLANGEVCEDDNCAI